MWISMNLSNNNQNSPVDTAAADCGIDTTVSAMSAQGKGKCEIVNPPGMISVPGKYNDMVIVHTDSGMMCIGVRMPYYERNIEPGEILLMSDGGATIKLSNDGNVYINGREV